MLTDSSGSSISVAVFSGQVTDAGSIALPSVNPVATGGNPFAWISASGSLLFGPSGIQYTFDSTGNLSASGMHNNNVNRDYISTLVANANASVATSGTTNLDITLSTGGDAASFTCTIQNAAYQGQESIARKLTKAALDSCSITPSNTAFMVATVEASLADALGAMLQTPVAQVYVARAIINKTGMGPLVDKTIGKVSVARFDPGVTVQALCKIASLAFSYKQKDQETTVQVKDVFLGLNIS